MKCRNSLVKRDAKFSDAVENCKTIKFARTKSCMANLLGTRDLWVWRQIIHSWSTDLTVAIWCKICWDLWSLLISRISMASPVGTWWSWGCCPVPQIFFPLPGDLLAQSHFLRNFLRDTSEERVKVYLYEKRHMCCGSKRSWTVKVFKGHWKVTFPSFPHSVTVRSSATT
jgi:hypothetical protein